MFSENQGKWDGLKRKGGENMWGGRLKNLDGVEEVGGLKKEEDWRNG